MEFLNCVDPGNQEKWISVMPLNRLTNHEWIEYEMHIKRRLEQAFRIQHPLDWTRISGEQLLTETASPLLDLQFLLKMLHLWYPEIQFSKYQFHRNKRSTQRWLFMLVREIFEQNCMGDEVGIEVLEEKTLELLDDERNPVYLQADIYVPQFNLVVEYHGEQHYTQQSRQQLNRMETTLRNDEQRRQLFARNGVLHVEIPYWWDQSVDQLQASLHEAYPFLVSRPEPGVRAVPEALPPAMREENVQARSLHVEDYFVMHTGADLHSYTLQELHNGLFVIIMDSELFTADGRRISTPDTISQELRHFRHSESIVHGVLFCEGHTGPNRLNALLHDDDISLDAWQHVHCQVLSVSEEYSSSFAGNGQLKESKFFTYSPKHAFSPEQHFTMTAKEAFQKNLRGFLATNLDAENTPKYLLLRPWQQFQALLINKDQSTITVRTTWGRELSVEKSSFWTQHDDEDAVPEKSVVSCAYEQSVPTEGGTKINLLSLDRSTTWDQVILSHHVIETIDFHQLLLQAINEKRMDMETKRYSTKAKRNLIHQILTHNNDVYPTPEEQRKMCETLKVDLNTIQKYLGAARSKMRHQFGEVSDDLKNELSSRLRCTTRLSSKELQELSTIYNVGVKRIQSYIDGLYQPPSQPLKDSHKSVLREWIEKHEYFQLTPDVLARFASQMKVAPTVIRRYLYERSKRHGQLSPEQRSILTKWYEQHSYDTLTDPALQELATRCSLSTARIRAFLYVHHHKGGANLSESQRNTLKERITQHHSNTGEELLPPHEVRNLSHQFRVSEPKIQSFVSQFIRLTAQTLSDEQKKIISEWYSKHKKHSQTEIHELSERIQAHAPRVQQFIYGLSRTGKLTKEQEIALHEWISTHHYSQLTADEIGRLSRELNVNEKRVRSFVYTCNSRALTNEQQSVLNEWIRNHKFSDLREKELEMLSDKIMVIKSRIKRYVRDRTPVLENVKC